jgi:two-component system NtrC family sensor kinase
LEYGFGVLPSLSIRSKLIGLLSVLLLLVLVTSTIAGRVLLKRRVDDHMRREAEATAQDLATNLEDYLKHERSDDEVKARLEDLRGRHRIFELSLLVDSESGDKIQIVLPQTGVAEISRPERPRHPRSERVLSYEARRALWDRGQPSRPPLLRGVEPLWRLPDRGTSSRWAQAFPAQQESPVKPSRSINVSEGSAMCQHCVTALADLDPMGPQRGKLRVTVPLDRYDQVLSDQIGISAVTALGALLVLLLATVWIVNRVVARPVSELAQAMREVEQGNLQRRVGFGQTDEIGKLAQGFNAMLDRLALADEEIRGLNARLAGDILAATRDLQSKNEALQQLNQILLQMQRELGDKERLAALGQLAAQLAHEIGTPLAAVSGHLQLAAFDKELPPALRDRLQVATSELSRVSKIIRDYLDHTRAGKPSIVAADLRRLVEEAVRVTTSALRRPGIRIVTEIGPEAATVQTDPGLLRQILINLLTNAIDATAAHQADLGSGGPPTGRIFVSAKVAEDRIVLAVRDEGTGIPGEDLQRIFEPFYTTKGRGRGTGLGLSICRELTRSLGGKITVESAPGQGSTFALHLPIVPLVKQAA